MICTEKGCDGKIDETIIIRLLSGNGIIGYHGDSFYCSKCGRLYWNEGLEPVFVTGTEKKLFFRNNSVFVINPNGSERKAGIDRWYLYNPNSERRRLIKKMLSGCSLEKCENEE